MEDVSTGGARPLHTCGMSRTGQKSAEVLVANGADVEAMDTYGYRPLHRMASNNLEIGAATLLRAGADPNAKTPQGDSPLSVARQSHAFRVVQVIEEHLKNVQSREAKGAVFF